jgi:hypothetical protein
MRLFDPIVGAEQQHPNFQVLLRIDCRASSTPEIAAGFHESVLRPKPVAQFLSESDPPMP